MNLGYLKKIVTLSLFVLKVLVFLEFLWVKLKF